MSLRRSTTLVFLLFLLVAVLPACHVFRNAREAISGGFETGIAGGIQKARIDSLVKASADSVLNVVLKTERFQSLRRELGLVLSQTTDSLYYAADTLLNHMMRAYTAQWLTQMDAGVQTMLTNAKANLTDDELRAYIRALIREDLTASLNLLIDNLYAKIHALPLDQDLNRLAGILNRQVDSLARTATLGAVSVLNDSLLPKLDRLIDKLAEERGRAQSGLSNWMRNLLIGIGALVLLALLGRTLYTQWKYRRMLQLITAEVDKIDSQTVYDRLTHNINERMKTAGLEETLRKDILAKQGLLEQAEWKEKDAQLLRTLVTEIEKNKTVPEAEIKEKLQERGLGEHFESVKRSLGQPPENG